MGLWNEMCGISKLPITYEESIVIVPILKSKVMKQSLIVPTYFYGVYDSYGGFYIENDEGFLEFCSICLKSNNLINKNMYSDENEFAEKIINTHKNDIKFSSTLLHYMLLNTVGETAISNFNKDYKYLNDEYIQFELDFIFIKPEVFKQCINKTNINIFTFDKTTRLDFDNIFKDDINRLKGYFSFKPDEDSIWIDFNIIFTPIVDDLFERQFKGLLKNKYSELITTRRLDIIYLIFFLTEVGQKLTRDILYDSFGLDSYKTFNEIVRNQIITEENNYQLDEF